MSLNDSTNKEEVEEEGPVRDMKKTLDIIDEEVGDEEAHFKREFFGQLIGKREDLVQVQETEEETLILDEDYFSYALFAFYIFEEEDALMVRGDARITDYNLNLKK